MTVLHSVDFFPSKGASVAIEPRLPQVAFPEHHHDFCEIVIVEHGTGTHIFNGQPYTLSGGSVCFVREHDRHLYEHTENLFLTNVLYRSAGGFSFISGLEKLLPQEQDGFYPSHWRVSQNVLQQIKPLLSQLELAGDNAEINAVACREMAFMQLLVLLRQGSLAQNHPSPDGRVDQLLTWLEQHFAEDVCWDELAEQHALSLRTLHRQLKQRTGLTPQRYLNRLRLIKARHLLRHSEDSITNIAYLCGFGDSNHFSTLFKREFTWSPRDIRLGRDTQLQ
ncbi:HTH-type transcriptional activator RhaS [Mangrovibacter plantisponsor]|uniref:HTH-type transcriptional activator RhaS n=1 Tax=Mangrovibacter plantisponsor TaxID=451513 RepID=A0A317PWL0_9ENTR|nr:HTH-type transcriptional activator RhaS [Mangrovibacter plantisponsor]PWW06675.1 AraC family transcriptional regulator [Mangrovibacter plantisponsor]